MTIFERLAYTQPMILLVLHALGLIDIYAMAGEMGLPSFPRLMAQGRRYRRARRGRIRQVGGWAG